VLDEPFNHLDRDSRIVMVSSLTRFVTSLNKCVIVSSHEGFESDPSLDELTVKHIAL
jgi:ABC-type multidrug transport system ATPase subunit